MRRGGSHPDDRIGTSVEESALGDLLGRRAEVIQRNADDDEIWTEGWQGAFSESASD
jgi:hypothetical protein